MFLLFVRRAHCWEIFICLANPFTSFTLTFAPKEIINEKNTDRFVRCKYVLIILEDLIVVDFLMGLTVGKYL